MTREEAKTILEEVKMLDDSMYQYNPIYLEALDMAISALKDIEKIKRARDEISDFNIRKFYANFTEPFQLGICTGMDKSVEIIDKYIVPNKYVDYQDRAGADMKGGAE